MSGLPDGWAMRQLDSLKAPEPRSMTDGPFGSNLTSAHYTASGARVVRLQNIGDGAFIDNPAFISMTHYETLRKHAVQEGDLLIASLGEVLPRACIAPALLGPAIVKADCIRVRLSAEVEPRWVLYALQAPDTRKWAKDQLHGVGRPRLGLKVIRSIPVPVPPLDEQRRIVEILEDHLSRLDVADAYLAASERRLASLLASLRSGAYRFEVNRTLLADVAEVQGGILKNASRSPHENTAPFLRVANVTKGGLVLDEVHRIEVFTGERERYRLQAGDLLVVEGNGSPSQIGRAALWDGSIPDAVHQNHLIRVRPRECLLPGFLELIWNSPENRERLTRLSSLSSGLHTLSTGKLRSLDIPVPSLERQAAFVTRADDLRDEVRRTSSAVVQAASRCIALRRALLHAAFTGRLTGHASDTDRAEELAATSS